MIYSLLRFYRDSKRSTHPRKDQLPFTTAEERLAEEFKAKRKKAEQKFPLEFALATTFGIVSTFYGFEKLIDRVDLFVQHPWILLIAGLLTLYVTGAIYRKLS
jgi:hypothetical protein